MLLLFALFPGRGWAQLVDVPVIYAATAPTVDSFTPAQSGPGGTIMIKGRNFRNVVAVSFGPTFTVLSPTQIRAIVGMFPFQASTKFSVGVKTRAGLAFAKEMFTYIPTGRIPDVLGLTLMVAEQKVTQAGFTVGTITGPTAPSSIVKNQAPAGGSVVPTTTKVALTTQTPVNGFSGATVFNNLESGDSVYVYLFDYSTNQWTIQNGGALLAFQNMSSAITFTTGHFYMLSVVDPQLCMSPAPDDSTCVPWFVPGPIPGDQNGPTKHCTTDNNPC
jgi:hypothetical protein